MKQETNETIVPSDAARKIYRLICISSPGKKTGRKRNGRAAPAVVQTDEHAAKKQGKREKFLRERRLRVPEGKPLMVEETGRLQVGEERNDPVVSAPVTAASSNAEPASPDTAGGGAV